MNIKRLLYWGSLIVCFSGAVICAAKLLQQQRAYHLGETAYAQLAQETVALPSSASQQNQTPQPNQTQQEAEKPNIDLSKLTDMNPDFIGWLYSAGTVLSYPVVQGEDNTYYLSHLFDGTENSAGCLFIDSQWDALQDKNCVIYGHHMKNGSMFALLERYEQQEYYQAHPTLVWVTSEGMCTIELFSAYTTKAGSNAWQMRFSSEEDYAAWLEQVRARSCFDSVITPQTTDKVMTLSTCSYAYEDARFVCHGIIRED